MTQSAPTFAETGIWIAEAMRQRGIPDYIVEIYRRRLNAEAGDSKEVPCPFCFVRETIGRLILQPARGGDQFMRCTACNEEVLLRRLS